MFVPTLSVQHQKPSTRISSILTASAASTLGRKLMDILCYWLPTGPWIGPRWGFRRVPTRMLPSQSWSLCVHRRMSTVTRSAELEMPADRILGIEIVAASCKITWFVRGRPSWSIAVVDLSCSRLVISIRLLLSDLLLVMPFPTKFERSIKAASSWLVSI